MFIASAMIALAACGTGTVVPATAGVETQIAQSVDGTLTAVAALHPTATPTVTEPPASPTPTVTPDMLDAASSIGLCRLH